MIYRGWAEVKNGDVTKGISLIRDGLSDYRFTGTELYLPHDIALLAAAFEIAGQIDESLTQFDDALQIAEPTGEHWFTAELYRHKGQLRLRQGHAEAAEELCRKGARHRPRSGRQALGVAGCREPRAAVARPRIGAAKPAICSRRSTAGSPRASTPPTSKRLRRCWKSL